MKTVDEIVDAVGRFIDGHVVPSCRSDLAKFKAGFAKPLVAARVRAVASHYAEGGSVDESVLRDCVSSGFDAAGTVRVGDFRFDRADADEFFRILCGEAPQ